MKLKQFVLEGARKNVDHFEEVPHGKDKAAQWTAIKNLCAARKAKLFERLQPFIKQGLISMKDRNPYWMAANKNEWIPYGKDFMYQEHAPKEALKYAQQWMKMDQRYMDALHAETDAVNEESARKRESVEKRRANADSKWSDAFDKGNTIPEIDVPEEVDVYRSRIENCYFMSEVNRYAGDADTFPFTAPARKIYDQVNAIIKRNGIPPFHTLYSSRTTSVSEEFGETQFDSHIVVAGKCLPTGGKDSVVLERVRNGERYFRNSIWISGMRYKLKDFLALPEADQDQKMQGYGK